VTVSNNRTVPVKILNPGNDPVVIPKGKFISKFTELNKDYDIWRINPDDKQVNCCTRSVHPREGVSSVTNISRF
jgi:oligoribonuclease NrnB/cAMP/cGMP phosphodiesterase (DHH superfamily)